MKTFITLFIMLLSLTAYAHCCPGNCCPAESESYKLAMLNKDFAKFIAAKERQIEIEQAEIDNAADINNSFTGPSLVYSPEYHSKVNQKLEYATEDLKSRLIDLEVSFMDKNIFDLAHDCLKFLEAQSKLDIGSPHFAYPDQYREWQKKLNDALTRDIKNQFTR